MAYLYVIRCQGDTLYTGIATDIGRRMREHMEQGSRCAKYTRTHKIQRLEAFWQVDTYAHAAKGEWAVKRLPKIKKEALIREPEKLADFCPNLGEYPFVPQKPVPLSSFYR